MMDVAKEWEILQTDRLEKRIYRRIADVGLRLLVMEPEQPSNCPRPCLIFIHGGGFNSGKPEIFLPQCRYFTRLGYVCVSVEYRLMQKEENFRSVEDQITLEDCIVDCKEAVRYVRSHAHEWNIHPNRIGLLGDSAGGYLACAVTSLKHVENTTTSSVVSCVPEVLVVYNPVTQLIGKSKIRIQQNLLSSDGFSPENATLLWQERHQLERQLSPVAHVSAQHPSTLLMHGLLDTIVPPEDSVEYAERLRELGITVKLELLPASKHAFALFNYTATDDEVAHTLNITRDFLSSILLCD